jgi:negative regulator of sigma E activity
MSYFYFLSLWKSFNVQKPIFMKINSSQLSLPEIRSEHDFNAIVLWLLDLNAPLRRYIKKDDVISWFTFDIQKAIVERDFAYRVWKSRRRDQDRNRYKEQRKRVNYMVREAKRSYMK